jgi:hypothetical protein
MSMARTANIGRARNVSSSAPFVELHHSFASRAAAISPFVDQLMEFINLFMGEFEAEFALGGGLRIEFKLKRQAFLAAAGVGVMTTSFSELQRAVAQQATGGALR